jgi:hypothetical protein
MPFLERSVEGHGSAPLLIVPAHEFKEEYRLARLTATCTRRNLQAASPGPRNASDSGVTPSHCPELLGRRLIARS